MTNKELASQLKQMSERAQKFQDAIATRTSLLERIRNDYSLSFSDRLELEIEVYSAYNKFLAE